MSPAIVPADLSQFVHDEITSGRFADADAVVVHALHLLQRDREEAVLGIQRGLEDAVAGRVQPLADVFDELRREPVSSGT